MFADYYAAFNVIINGFLSHKRTEMPFSVP